VWDAAAQAASIYSRNVKGTFNMRTHFSVAALIASATIACGGSSTSARDAILGTLRSDTLTLEQLSPGDSRCPAGGTLLTAGDQTTFVCNGDPGPAGSVGATGSQGPQGLTGVQGPPGGGLYTSRADIYCNESAVGTTTGVLIATCDTPDDLPLTGACEESESTPVHLQTNGQIQNWPNSNPSTPAEWMCGWTTASVPTGRARICCIQHP
jgi:hypothetical protein